MLDRALARCKCRFQPVLSDVVGKIRASEIVIYLAKRICEQPRGTITRPGGQKIACPSNLRIGIDVSVDIQEVSLLLMSLRDRFESWVIVVPTVVGDSHQSRVDRAYPPFIGIPIATDQTGAIQLNTGVGRRDHKAGGVELRLGVGPKFLDKVLHDI